jgi:hypothetical protein
MEGKSKIGIPGFEIIKIHGFVQPHLKKVIRFSDSGAMYINKAAAEALKLSELKTNTYMHICVSDQQLYVFFDNDPTDGLLISNNNKKKEIMMWSREVVRALAKRMDWPMFNGKLKSVKYIIDVDNTIISPDNDILYPLK